MRWLWLAVALVFALPIVPAAAQIIPYPTNAGLYNCVTSYGATGNGHTDDTAALQSCLTASVAVSRSRGWNEIVLPAGTYVISSQLSISNTPAEAKLLVIRGSGEGVTKIVLASNSPGFGNPAIPLSMFTTCLGGACGGNVQAFMLQLDDLTISTGYGNPGAEPLQMIVNNAGGVRNVSLECPGGGYAGLDLTQTYQGPALFDKLSIAGCNHAIITAGGSQYIDTFKDLSISGQVNDGLLLNGFVVAIDGLKSVNSVPAVIIQKSSVAFITHGDLAAPVDTSNQAILIAEGSHLHVQQTTIGPHYAATSQSTANDGLGAGQIVCATIETVSMALTYNPACTPMYAPLERPPIPPVDPLSDWVVPSAYTGAALQTALNSGDGTVYLVNSQGASSMYDVTSTLTVPPTVDRIIGFGTALMNDVTFNSATPVLSIAPRTTPLVIEDVSFYVTGQTAPLITYSGNTGDIILRDFLNANSISEFYTGTSASASAAHLWLSDLAVGQIASNQTTTCWNCDLEQAPFKLVNNGGRMNIYGLKNEEGGSEATTDGGGSTNIFGGFLLLNVNTPTTLPEFAVNQGSSCIDYVEGTNSPLGRGYTQFTTLMGSAQTGQVLYNVAGQLGYPIGNAFMNLCGSVSPHMPGLLLAAPNVALSATPTTFLGAR